MKQLDYNYKFDISNMAGLAYKKSWDERQYLLKMLILPFLVKLACFSVVVVYIERENLWLTGVAMLPALFLEGWFLAHWARTLMTGGQHRWPFRPSGDGKKDLVEMMVRSRGIMLGALSFVVINYLFYGYQSLMLNALPEDFNPNDPDPRLTIVALVAIISGFFLFRYLWLYIPLSLNAPLQTLLKIVEPIKLTPRLIALWMVCAVPSFLAFQLLTSLFVNIGGTEGLENVAASGQVIFVILQVAGTFIKNIIATAGFAYAFMFLLAAKK